VIVRGTPPVSPSTPASAFCSWFTPYTYHSRPTIASNPLSTSAVLACHVTWYLTRIYTYLLISVLFIISVTLYISSYLQEDPYPFLFGSPARYVSNLNIFGSPDSTAFRSVSRLTTVALTPAIHAQLAKFVDQPWICKNRWDQFYCLGTWEWLINIQYI